jgi:hypothetical protein
MKSPHALSLSHIIQYTLLIFILLMGLFVFITVPSFLLRVITAAILATVYPIWGIWHHWEHHRHFSWGVVIEYVLVSLLVVVVLVSLL